MEVKQLVNYSSRKKSCNFREPSFFIFFCNIPLMLLGENHPWKHRSLFFVYGYFLMMESLELNIPFQEYKIPQFTIAESYTPDNFVWQFWDKFQLIKYSTGFHSEAMILTACPFLHSKFPYSQHLLLYKSFHDIFFAASWLSARFITHIYPFPLWLLMVIWIKVCRFHK